VEQADILRVYVCIKTSEDEVRIRIDGECLSHIE
jgi:hypothetical protein